MNLKYILLTIVGIALLGIAYYGISPLFRNIELNEVDPSLPQPTEASQEVKSIPQTREIKLEESVIKSAPVIGTAGHPASGAARIVESEGKKYLRYEDFKTINGPDLFVYLSKDMRASDFINLGALKATGGNVNYEIPENININDYPYALVWCRAFSVLFNSADLDLLY
ncbi:MAG: DM13 domain-containing protein [Parcubacteria group bacterium]|nr:DM13 domain-containing protein [Parcubacteria group bacterium]